MGNGYWPGFASDKMLSEIEFLKAKLRDALMELGRYDEADWYANKRRA